MAWASKERSICFIHLPKGMGQFCRNVLRKKWKWDEDGPYHGLPQKHYTFSFVIWRHPAHWLRSYWAYRTRDDWNYRKGLVGHAWYELNTITLPFATDDLYEWYLHTTAGKLKGLVSWFYGYYAPPGVNVIQDYNLDEFLTYHGFDPQSVQPTNVGYIKTPGDMPEIPPEFIYKAEDAEPFVMERYSTKHWEWMGHPVPEISQEISGEHDKGIVRAFAEGAERSGYVIDSHPMREDTDGGRNTEPEV